MIKEFEFYHGVVFAALFHRGAEPLKVERYPSSDNSSYVVNGSIGIYIKYSTKRMSPWGFTFERRHNAEIAEMGGRYGRVVVMLVCKDDGIVGLTYDEFIQIVDLTLETTEWVSVVRRPKEKYTVKGQHGKLSYKIGMTDFCDKLFGRIARP